MTPSPTTSIHENALWEAAAFGVYGMPFGYLVASNLIGGSSSARLVVLFAIALLVGLAAGLAWTLLIRRERPVGLRQAIIVGFVAGLLFQLLLSMLWMALILAMELTAVDSLAELASTSVWTTVTGLEMLLFSVVIGGVVSIGTGVVASVLYVLVTRRVVRLGTTSRS